MTETDGYVTMIDADSGRVDVPLNMTLEWFDLLRSGVVGVIRLEPAEVGDGTWCLTYQEVPAVTAADARAAAEAEDADE